MASETGWTKEFPKVDGDYFCRLNEHDLCPVSFRLENGKIYEYGCGGNLYSQYVAKWDDYEYLGPFSASDAEQLSELRRAAEQFVNAYQGKEQQLGNGQALRSFLRFRELLNPQPGKETQGR